MKFSIIVPVYNVKECIENCLNSVVAQLYDNIECIIVDDCSPDDSMVVVASFLSKYKGNITFKIVTHEKNKGLSAARNSGVKVATGDYLFFLDSDDELSLNAMELFASNLKKYGDADFLIGNFEILGALNYSPLRTEALLDSNDKILEAYILGKWYVMAWGKLINRNFFFQKNLWFKDNLLHEDELFSFRLAMFASRMVSIKENVYRYVIRNNSITTNRKEKNYWDYLWIISENISLVYEQIPVSFYKSFYSYFVSVLYTHSFFILNENKLSVDNKKDMMREVRRLLVIIHRMRKGCSIKVRLKCHMLHVPYKIILMEMKIHYWMRKLCKY
ncbi:MULTISPECIES: glycosyltransferase family 2 protein [Butyricimonas]|uniref:glycosyltransferase family 2 protein n=1 Tax=Butyricimonas TaxID=574697 RepID=UPI0007FB4DC5|nr:MULTISPECIES: glycosyltransferase family 2 protein [Butyricimonas]